jgi:pilus assembly protein CpaF
MALVPSSSNSSGNNGGRDDSTGRPFMANLRLARLHQAPTTDLVAEATDSRADGKSSGVSPQTESARAITSAELRGRIHDLVIREIDPRQLAAEADLDQARRSIESVIESVLTDEGVSLSRTDRANLITELADEVLGYGPIEPLLRDATITEIMINSYDKIYFERKGILQLSNRSFRDNAQVMWLIDKIVAPLGRHIDEASPMVDARLPDGSRVHAVIPPLSVHGPAVTIRKFSKDPLTSEDLIGFGTITQDTIDFLRACVIGRLNIIVSGGTGSGKTTMLNLLSSFIPPRERIVTIEDPAELQIRQDDWVSLETRPPNIEGKGEVTQRELLRNALRMRPDRIVVGECRSGEAFDMLQAMNTGHEGSLTTVHANGPRDALSRIENMVLMASLDLPIRAIREQISSAVQLLVHLSRMQDGSRKVTHISEIVGMEGDVITMHDLFSFKQSSIAADGTIIGRVEPSGLRPKYIDRIASHGVQLAAEIFQPGASQARQRQSTPAPAPER